MVTWGAQANAWVEGRGVDGATLRRVAFAVAALGIIGMWTNLVGYSGSFLRSTPTSKFAYQLGSLVMALLFFALPRGVERVRGVASSVVPAMMAVATAAYGAAYLQDRVDPAALVDACCGLLGACYIWFVLTLYGVIARFADMPIAIAGITAAQVMEQVLASALNMLLDDVGQAAVCVALPPLAAALLVLGARSEGRPATRVSHPPAARRYQILLIATVAVASSVMSRVCSVGAWGTVRPDYQSEGGLPTILVACALLVLFSYACLYRPSKSPLNIRYQPAFLLMIAGYLFILFAAPYLPADAPLLTALDYAFEFFGHVTMWVVAVDSAQRLELHPNRVLGLMLLFGPFLGMVWPARDAVNVSVVLLLTYFVVVVIAVLPYITDYLGQRAVVGGVAGAALAGEGVPAEGSGAALVDAAHKRCVLLAARRGLTDRELEVMELLVRGKTRANIQELLFISESTVKTHIKHIYAKFGVATVTELMDTVFRAEGE